MSSPFLFENKEPYGDNDYNKKIRVIKKMKRVINFSSLDSN